MRNNRASVRVQRGSEAADMSEKSKNAKFFFFHCVNLRFKARCTYFQEFIVRQKEQRSQMSRLRGSVRPQLSILRVSMFVVDI